MNLTSFTSTGQKYFNSVKLLHSFIQNDKIHKNQSILELKKKRKKQTQNFAHAPKTINSGSLFVWNFLFYDNFFNYTDQLHLMKHHEKQTTNLQFLLSRNQEKRCSFFICDFQQFVQTPIVFEFAHVVLWHFASHFNNFGT